jgi:hypothetical protein
MERETVVREALSLSIKGREQTRTDKVLRQNVYFSIQYSVSACVSFRPAGYRARR